jgi:hypothetical protein
VISASSPRAAQWRHYDLSLRFQHLSNAGISNPNPGINFLELRMSYARR